MWDLVWDIYPLIPHTLPGSHDVNLVPRVFSLFNMAAVREKTLAHSRSRVSNEDGDVFKMAAKATRWRRSGYEITAGAK